MKSSGKVLAIALLFVVRVDGARARETEQRDGVKHLVAAGSKLHLGGLLVVLEATGTEKKKWIESQNKKKEGEKE